MTTLIKNDAGQLLIAEGMLWNHGTAPDCECPCYEPGFCSELDDIKRVVIRGSGRLKISGTVSHPGGTIYQGGVAVEYDTYNSNFTIEIPIPPIIAVWTYNSALSSTNKYRLIEDNWSGNKMKTTGVDEGNTTTIPTFSQLSDTISFLNVQFIGSISGGGSVTLPVTKLNKPHVRRAVGGSDDNVAVVVSDTDLTRTLGGCPGSCCPGTESTREVSGPDYGFAPSINPNNIGYDFTYSVEWPTTTTHLYGT